MHSTAGLLISIMLTTTASAATFEAQKQATLKQQAALDQACEAARAIKLEPLRQQIFDECLQTEKSTSAAEKCKQQAAAYNGNRGELTPRFYDLPECEQAFDFKRNNPLSN